MSDWKRCLRPCGPATQDDVDTLVSMFTEKDREDIASGDDWALARIVLRIQRSLPSDSIMLFIQVWA